MWGKPLIFYLHRKKPQRESLDSLCGFFDGNREENGKRASPIHTCGEAATTP